MRLWQRIVADMLLFLAISGLLPHLLYIRSIWIALIASVVLAVLNALIKPILSILSFPITLLTLGLFTIIINGIMLELTAAVVGAGFYFSSFGAAVLVAILLSIANTIISNHFQRV
ncbi:hypothetical protein IV38_GL001490 [Lactobacillus selangorensis]|uniref:Integral membrane protein n=1 Tax=Lactobacillus selangorensis TaxID=81857 RepID=A0A0R2G5C0_9LACO|nr:phage holin family protein [Lactobacillus selangorensis]KRN28488.1 hypothetical protein IV38_GL001490 [Lactobacillus selangorensis]KRN31988.1 hypothetical protein IV40_GL001276 [Lactobacillus selangorensis]